MDTVHLWAYLHHDSDKSEIRALFPSVAWLLNSKRAMLYARSHIQGTLTYPPSRLRLGLRSFVVALALRILLGRVLTALRAPSLIRVHLHHHLG